MYIVTASPVGPFAKALGDRLEADTTYMALSTGGIFSALPDATKIAPPYTVLSARSGHEDASAGAMQREGQRVRVTLDVWSAKTTPAEVQAMLSRAYVLLQRFALVVEGFVLMAGSLVCENSEIEQEFDPDVPRQTLYRGTQRWTAIVDEI